MSQPCHVCGRPAAHAIGNCWFCSRHFERALHERHSKRRADIASVAALAAFVTVAAAVQRIVQPTFAPSALLITGIVMAGVPAAVWLWFFHRRDRLEPEPTGTVVEVALLGGLVAAAVGMPLVDRVFEASTWLYRSPWAHLLGAVLVIGVTQEVLKYAVVRFSVYPHPLFDELTDGIVYASAAGLGYATALNIAFVIESGGAHLGLTAVRVTLTALAQAAFAGVTGYFLGRQKLQHRPFWWMPLGIAVAAGLNGAFHLARGALGRGALSADGGVARPWTGLVLAMLLVATVTLVLSRAMRRDIAAAKAAAVPAPGPGSTADADVTKTAPGPAPASGESPLRSASARPETRSVLAVFALAGCALALGWLVRGHLLHATRTVTAGCVNARVPVVWLSGSGSDPSALIAQSPSEPSRRVTVAVFRDGGSGSLEALATEQSALQASRLAGYRVLEEGARQEDGRTAHVVRYAYLSDAGDSLPAVIVGLTQYLRLGDERVAITMEADAAVIERALVELESIASSVSVREDCP